MIGDEKHEEHWYDDVRVRLEDVGGNPDVVRASELTRELHQLAEKNDWPCAVILLAAAGDTGVLPDGQVAEHGAAFTVWHLPHQDRCAAILPGFGWFGLMFSVCFHIWAAVASAPPAARELLLARIHRSVREVEP